MRVVASHIKKLRAEKLSSDENILPQHTSGLHGCVILGYQNDRDMNQPVFLNLLGDMDDPGIEAASCATFINLFSSAT